MSSTFSKNAEKALENALHLAESFGHTYAGSDHLLLALSEDKDSRLAEMLARCDIDSEKIKKAILDHSGCAVKTQLTTTDTTPKFRKILLEANEISKRSKDDKINTEHLFLAICKEESTATKILRELGVDLENAKYFEDELLTVNDSYWDTLRLANELYEAGEYEKAEELYKKIANEKDVFGDASAHYGYLLDEMGRYEEAFTCFCQALNGDTSPAEGVSAFLDKRLCDEDSPYWHYWQRNFDWRLRRYLETCESIGKKPDLERVLLNCSKSKNDFCASQVIGSLIQIYGTGKLVLSNYGEGNDEVVDVAGFPAVEKLKKFVAEAVKDEFDVWDIIYAFCYDLEKADETSAKALETALLAVKYDQAQKTANVILFWLYLSGEVYDNDNNCLISCPSFINLHKAAEIMLNIGLEELIDALLDSVDGEIISDLLEEAHRISPDDEGLAITLLLNVKTDRLPEVVGNLPDHCAKSLLSDENDNVWYSIVDGGVGIEDAEEFEAYYMSLLDFLSKYKVQDERCSDIQKLLLSAYQFGEYLNYASKYEISELEDHQKATEFAEKYGIELLNEPFDL